MVHASDTELNTAGLEALRAVLAEPEKRRVLAECLAVSELLQGCIIDKNYRIPDQFVASLSYTALGHKVIQDVLANNNRLKPNEVKIATFLRFGCPEGLFLTEDTNIEQLRRAVTQQISAGRIFYPYVFGRELHDLAVQDFPRAYSLNNAQTISILKRLPVGIFQSGHTVVGPFGCLVAGSPRSLPPAQQAFGYYCADASCDVVHPISLSTALRKPSQAGIIRANEAVDALLRDKYSLQEDFFAVEMRRATDKEYRRYPPRPTDTLIEMLADALSPAELDAVAERALRIHLKEKEDARALSKRIATVIQDPHQFIQSLTRAHLLQLLLLFADFTIERAIDAAVAEGDLEIAEFDIRIGRVPRFPADSVGRAEIGRDGLRYTGDVSTRLMELLHYVYFEKAVLEPADLAYSLGADADGVSEQQLLDLAVQIKTPEEILDDLILPYRKAAESALEFLGVSQSRNRAEQATTLLWKLAVPASAGFKDLEDISRHESALISAVQSDSTQDVVAGLITNLFKSLETAMQRALEFSIWVLSNDHFLAESAFTFDPASAGHRAQFVDELAPTDNPALQLRYSGKNTLQPLAAAFGRLTKALQSLDEGDYLRPLKQYPAICRSSPRPFSFPSTLPFFNLSKESREAILATFKRVAEHLGDATVVKVRNTGVHGNNEFPTSAEILVAVENVSKGKTELYDSGLYPRLYQLEEVRQDAHNRGQLTYASGVDHIQINTPQWGIAPKLPASTPEMLIIRRAATSTSGPLRFVVNAREGDDPYWKGFPRRWDRDTEYTAQVPQLPALDESSAAG